MANKTLSESLFDLQLAFMELKIEIKKQMPYAQDIKTMAIWFLFGFITLGSFLFASWIDSSDEDKFFIEYCKSLDNGHMDYKHLQVECDKRGNKNGN